VPASIAEFAVRPDPDDPRLSVTVPGIDHEGRAVETAVVTERPLTLFLNAREIVTMMTIGDRPDLLAVGYLLNQNMLKGDDEITAVEYEEDIATVVVRTRQQTDFEDKLRKKTQTSGCAQGTVFGDLMEEFDKVERNPNAKVRTSWLYQLTKKINTQPSLYLKAGAIHGCVLARRTGRCSTSRTSAATTPSTRSPAICSSTASRRTTRFSTPPAGSPPRWSSRP
jgi:FdhD protein